MSLCSCLLCKGAAGRPGAAGGVEGVAAQVVDPGTVAVARRQVVPDLYGAGEVTWQSGGYSESVCFGKIAGRNAANAIAEESAAA